jgi:hypothetical protein
MPNDTEFTLSLFDNTALTGLTHPGRKPRRSHHHAHRRDSHRGTGRRLTRFRLQQNIVSLFIIRKMLVLHHLIARYKIYGRATRGQKRE